MHHHECYLWWKLLLLLALKQSGGPPWRGLGMNACDVSADKGAYGFPLLEALCVHTDFVQNSCWYCLLPSL